jgi:hypothetical protein
MHKRFSISFTNDKIIANHIFDGFFNEQSVTKDTKPSEKWNFVEFVTLIILVKKDSNLLNKSWCYTQKRQLIIVHQSRIFEIVEYFYSTIVIYWVNWEIVFTKMINVISSTKFHRRNIFLRTLCFLWLTIHESIHQKSDSQSFCRWSNLQRIICAFINKLLRVKSN